MIHEVDSALRTLIERDAPGMRDVEIVFDAPTREWAGRRNSPTVDIYLYDIREDLRRRERGMHNVYDESKIVIARHLPPRHFKLSYLVTAWTQRPEDEHRLLSSLLTCFLKYDALPNDVLTAPLTDLGLPIPITIALPPPEDRAFADVWSALGGELKPSIDLVVTTPVDTGQQFHTGPAVQRPPQVSLGGSKGWPTRETKSRNGVIVWPDGTHGPASAAGHGGEGLPATDGAAPQTRRGRGSRRTSDTADHPAETIEPESGTAESGTAESGTAESGTAEPNAAESDDWTIATGWADVLARRQAGVPEPSGTGRQDRAAKKSATGPAKTGGRPGPRIAITRKRQPKKGS